MKKKKFEVYYGSAAGWTGQHEGWYCALFSRGVIQLSGDICKRKQDAMRSFLRRANRLGIPRENYEFKETTK